MTQPDIEGRWPVTYLRTVDDQIGAACKRCGWTGPTRPTDLPKLRAWIEGHRDRNSHFLDCFANTEGSP